MRRQIFLKRSSLALWAAFITLTALVPAREAIAGEAFNLLRSQTKLLLGLEVVNASSDHEAALVTERVAELLSKPLTPSSAAQVALYKSPIVRELYDELSAVPAVEQTQPVSRSAAGDVAVPGSAETLGEANVEAIHRQIEEARLRIRAYQAVNGTLAVAADAERAFYRAVAAKLVFDLVGRLQSSTDIAAELRRMQIATGAATTLMATEADVFNAELRIELASARHELEISRLELVRTLGLTPAADISLPDALPNFPEAPTTPSVSAAAARRPDLMSMRWQLNVQEWLQQLSAPEQIDETGDDALANREAEILSEVQLAFSGYRAAYEIALTYENTIVPLSRSITEQRLLLYNGMLIDVTDLLAAARDGLRREVSALEAKRDLFLAKTNFQVAVIGGDQNDDSSDIPARTKSAPESSGDH